METNPLHFLWVEKYRPTKIADCILPDNVKNSFNDFLAKGDFPHLLLTSQQPGTGKTTTALALCKELELNDVLFINASKESSVDVLRTRITDFCLAPSWEDKPKVVILDESDAMSSQFQSALRAFIEEYSKYIRFILTANYKHKLIEPLHSRLTEINFGVPNQDRTKMMKEFFLRVSQILVTENVSFDKDTLGNVIKKYFPDLRKTLGVLQRFSSSGTLTVESLINSETDFDDLMEILKGKKFGQMREFVGKNPDVPLQAYSRFLYDKCIILLEAKSIPNLILILAQYDYKNSFVVDKEINIVAMLTEVMKLSWN